MTIEAARLSVVVDADTKGAESGLDRMGGVVSKAGDGLKTAALAGVGFATAIGVASVGASISLENAFTPIGTLLGNTSPQFEALSGELKNFVMNSPSSADQIGMAAYMTLSAGITDTTKVMETLTASQQLALAGLGDIGQANDLITSAMNSFSQEGLTADKAAQLLFGTIASGKTTTTDLANGFGQIAPLAAGAGVSFNDLLAATAALTSTGQSASVAYSGIRGALTSIIKPTAEAAEMAEQLGIDFSQAHLAAIGLPAFLDEVKTATGGNVETMGMLFGGVEGLNTVMSLTGPQAAAFAANLEGVGTAGENLAVRAEEVSNTTANSFAEMKNKAMVALGGLGDHIVDWAMPKIELMVDWITEHWPQISATAKTVFGSVSKFIGDVLVPAFEKVVKFATNVVEWIVDNWPEISATIEETIDAVVNAWETYGVPVMEGIIAAVTDVVDWITEHWPEISKTIGTVLNTVVDIVQTVLDIVMTLWETYGTEIVNFVKSAFLSIMTIIQGAMGIVRGIIDTVMGLIHGDWSRVWEGIKGIFSGIWTAIQGIVDLASGTIKGVLAVAWETIKSVADTAWEGIKSALQTVWDTITGIASSTWAAIKSAIMSPINTISALLQAVWDGVKSAAKTAWDILAGVAFIAWEALKATIMKPINVVKGLLDTAWEGVKSAAKTAWEGVKSAIEPIINTIKSIVQGLIDKIQWGIDKFNQLKSYALGGVKFDPTKPNPIFTAPGGGGGTPKLAGGGILDRPTAFIGGEYPGASSNPEIVAPQSMLRQIFRDELAALSSGGGTHLEISVDGRSKADADLAREISAEVAWQMKTMAA